LIITESFFFFVKSCKTWEKVILMNWPFFTTGFFLSEMILYDNPDFVFFSPWLLQEPKSRMAAMANSKEWFFFIFSVIVIVKRFLLMTCEIFARFVPGFRCFYRLQRSGDRPLQNIFWRTGLRQTRPCF